MSKSKTRQPIGEPSGEPVESEVSATGESEVASETSEPDATASEESDEAAVESEEIDEESEGGESIETLTACVSDLQDELLRKQADFENFRKRMFREREETSKYATSQLLLDLVEIIDNFERAIKSSEESQDFTSFHEGIELIEKQFLNMLDNKYGLKRFESDGDEFDPEKHEAIAVDQDGQHDVQTVVEVYQSGYMLHERVLRHAKVKVAIPTSEEAQTENGDTETTEQTTGE